MNETFENVSTAIDTLHNVTSMLVTHPLMTKLYVTGVTATTLVGGVGNVVVLLSLHVFQPKERKKQHISKAFWTNLALTDLLMCVVANPMVIVGVTQGQAFFMRHSLLCDIIASTCFISCICSLLSLTLVHLHHHVIIFNSWLTDLFAGYQYHSILCVMCWVISLMAEVPNFLLWGKQSFNEHSHQCMWDRSQNRSYTVFACIFLIAAPLVLIFISHIKIIVKVFREERKARIHTRELVVIPGAAITAENLELEPNLAANYSPRDAIVRLTPAIGSVTNAPGDDIVHETPAIRDSQLPAPNHGNDGVQVVNPQPDDGDLNIRFPNVGSGSIHPKVITTATHRARKLGTTLMVMALAYFVCWMPFVVVNLSDQSHQMPMVHLWVTFLAHAHAFVACIAYMMTNSHFARAFETRSGSSGLTVVPGVDP